MVILLKHFHLELSPNDYVNFRIIERDLPMKCIMGLT